MGIARLLFAVAVVMILGAVGGYGMAVVLPPPGTLGTYSVPMGTLTVQRDGTANYSPAVTFIPGACGVDDTNATTGERHRPYYACAPLNAPDGALMDWITADDGSATYGASPYAFDPEEWGFVDR